MLSGTGRCSQFQETTQGELTTTSPRPSPTVTSRCTRPSSISGKRDRFWKRKPHVAHARGKLSAASPPHWAYPGTKTPLVLRPKTNTNLRDCWSTFRKTRKTAKTLSKSINRTKESTSIPLPDKCSIFRPDRRRSILPITSIPNWATLSWARQRQTSRDRLPATVRRQGRDHRGQARRAKSRLDEPQPGLHWQLPHPQQNPPMVPATGARKISSRTRSRPARAEKAGLN